MTNLSVTDILEFAVFGLAVAQALTILLTIRRERDIDDLRELIDQQRLRMVELTAWLAGRNSVQARQLTSEVKPNDSPEAAQARTPEDEAARAEKALSWQREIAARLQEGLKGGTPAIGDAKAPDLPDQQRTGIAEHGLKRTTKSFNWFRTDPDEPREIAEARKMVADLKAGGSHAGPTIAPRESPSPSTEEELQRATRAIDRLKEDVDKARETAGSIAASKEKREAK